MKTRYFYSTVLLLMAFAACKKTEDVGTQMVTVSVVNASLDVAAVKVNPSDKAVSWSAITDQVNYGTGKFYYAPGGSATFKMVAIVDTSKLLVNNSFNLTGKLYTLYLTGNSTAVVPMLTEETSLRYTRLDMPVTASADSVVNVRFVNLSENSPALKVNIKDIATNEVASLAYKGISNWKSYKNNKAAGTDYIFEIRDASTGVLIISYTFKATATNTAAANLFKNVSLIIRGVYGTTTGTNAFGISPVNYY